MAVSSPRVKNTKSFHEEERTKCQQLLATCPFQEHTSMTNVYILTCFKRFIHSLTLRRMHLAPDAFEAYVLLKVERFINLTIPDADLIVLLKDKIKELLALSGYLIFFIAVKFNRRRRKHISQGESVSGRLIPMLNIHALGRPFPLIVPNIIRQVTPKEIAN